MRKRIKLKKLGKVFSHRKLMIKNQLKSLFQHGKVATTSVKAKVLKAEAQAVIAKLKNWTGDDLGRAKYLVEIFAKQSFCEKVIEYAKQADSAVGIVKTGHRAGDNAEVSEVSLIGFKKEKREKKEKTAAKGKEKVAKK